MQTEQTVTTQKPVETPTQVQKPRDEYSFTLHLPRGNQSDPGACTSDISAGHLVLSIFLAFICGFIVREFLKDVF